MKDYQKFESFNNVDDDFSYGTSTFGDIATSIFESLISANDSNAAHENPDDNFEAELLLKEINELLSEEPTPRGVNETEVDNMDSALVAEITAAIDDSRKRTFSESTSVDETKFEATKSVGSIKRPKRPKPQFVVNDAFIARLINYWDIIYTNQNYKYLMMNSAFKFKHEGYKEVDSNLFSKNVIPSLLPNNITIEYFDSHQGVDGWYYEENNKRPNTKLAMRWCGQKMNFYDPFVTRYQIDDAGKTIKKQALCPYCPLEKKVDLNNVFHSTQDSLYMHHVCKDHGVYSSGYELSAPMFVYDDTVPVAICTECGETCKMFNLGQGVENGLINYYRHAFNVHNKKKQNRTKEQKQHDHIFFNNTKTKYLYEEFNMKEAETLEKPKEETLTFESIIANLVPEEEIIELNLDNVNVNVDDFDFVYNRPVNYYEDLNYTYANKVYDPLSLPKQANGTDDFIVQIVNNIFN